MMTILASVQIMKVEI